MTQSLVAKYGLPSEVKFCKKCVISNQRPVSAVEFKHKPDSAKQAIQFDAEGVCDACRAAEQKNHHIDWAVREQELLELCDRYRSKDGSYDCLVPGSGGKDSFYAAHMLKFKYGMNPLTVTWAPHMYTPWGWENFQAWIHAGFDNYLATPNGQVHRLLTRLAVDKLFHPFQPFIIGQKALAPKLSVLLDIPLVFYGENEAEYGNPLKDNQSAQRDHKYCTVEDESKIFLSGVSVLELKERYGLSEQDMQFYMPAQPEALAKNKTEIHYLGYYLKWHPQGVYYYCVENGGFKPSPERTAGTYSKYNSIDDKLDDLHYYTSYTKFGIGRASYDAAQEIRNEDIERDEGVALVKKYDGEFPERFIDDIFQYLSIDEKHPLHGKGLFAQDKVDRDYFMSLVDQYRSPHLWEGTGVNAKLRHAVWHEQHQTK